MTTETEILQYLHYYPLSKRLEIGHAVTTEISERIKDRLPNTNSLLKLM